MGAFACLTALLRRKRAAVRRINRRVQPACFAGSDRKSAETGNDDDDGTRKGALLQLALFRPERSERRSANQISLALSAAAESPLMGLRFTVFRLIQAHLHINARDRHDDQPSHKEPMKWIYLSRLRETRMGSAARNAAPAARHLEAERAKCPTERNLPCLPIWLNRFTGAK